LTPRASVPNGRAFAFFTVGRYQEGLASAEQGGSINADAHTLSALALNLVGLNRIEEAKVTIAKLLHLHPSFTTTKAMKTFPTLSAEHRRRLISAFDRAALPL
jgi:hypothetical protein